MLHFLPHVNILLLYIVRLSMSPVSVRAQIRYGRACHRAISAQATILLSHSALQLERLQI